MTQEELWERLKTVDDPEMPGVSIVDLGMVVEFSLDGDEADVTLKPTFIGCPGLDWMKMRVQRALKPLASHVHYDMTRIWSQEDLTDEGREKLRVSGIAPPQLHSDLVECPMCGSTDTHRSSQFGSTLCRSIFYCESCQQPFEAWKKV